MIGHPLKVSNLISEVSTGGIQILEIQRSYVPGDMMLEGIEKEAREGKRGLWVASNPIPPWEWRHRR